MVHIMFVGVRVQETERQTLEIPGLGFNVYRVLGFGYSICVGFRVCSLLLVGSRISKSMFTGFKDSG